MANATIPQDLQAFLAEIAGAIERIDILAVKKHGMITSNTGAGLGDLIYHLLTPEDVRPGSAGLKALSVAHGSLGIERNSDVAWAVRVRRGDGHQFGFRELVAAISYNGPHTWLSPDAQDALAAARDILADPGVMLRGVAREEDGKPIR